MVQHQRAAGRSSCMEIRPFPQERGKNHEQMSRAQAESVANEGNCRRLEGKPISYCNVRTNCTTGGSFRIQLHRAPREVRDRDEDDLPTTITVYAIPEIRNRAEVGICITVPSSSRSSQGHPLYTTIRTFNVVPQNSEIILCVEMNDLEGVRRLIGEKKASPRDVDPRGFSLLSYAMFSGCSETFRLLLRGGASTEQCHRYDILCSVFSRCDKIDSSFYGNASNLIASIWDYYIASVSSLGDGENSRQGEGICDLGQCRSMTELALANGCLAGESVPFHPSILTALSNLSNIVLMQVTRCQVADALKQLLNAGYDREVQNDTGKMPLLFAALQLSLRCLTVVELLLAENTNVHAVDNQGRGALHLCLCFSLGLHESYDGVCRGSSSAPKDPFIAEYSTTTDVSGDRGLDLQHYDSSLKEVLLSDDGAGYDDEESDVDSACYDSEDVSNCTDDLLQSEGCYWCGDGTWIGVKGVEEDAAYHYCGVRDVDDFNTPESPDPEPKPWMCKARSRLKLLAFLNAGCNPNILDNDGLSPSDYAAEEGLWPQWEWPLSKSGFQYNEDTDSWERES